MEKNEKYAQTKKRYNSKLSTFQIDKTLHLKVKNYCKEKNVSVKDFLEKMILEKIS